MRPGIKLQNAFFSLVPDAGYGSHRRQNRRRNRCDNLHNPLKGLFLSHNRLIDLMVLALASVSFRRRANRLLINFTYLRLDSILRFP